MGKRYSCVAAVLALSLFSGCAWLPQAPQDPGDMPATRAQLDAHFTQLESVMVSQCAGQRERYDRQQQRLDRVTADLGEVGSLLRGLQADLADAGRDSMPATPECTIDANIGHKTLLGRSEWIGLPDVGTYLEARIDSGATTSSLSATEITPFERDGEDWVRFKLGLNDDDGAVDAIRGEWIEAPVDRRVRIIQASGEDDRPVISLLMTLGPLRETVQFTLNDRTHLDHPVLLGRRFLMDIALIDVAERYLHERPAFPDEQTVMDAGTEEADDLDEPPEG